MINKRLRNVIIIASVILVSLFILFTVLIISSSKNPYGDFIKIQNYSQKVKNLSKDYEHNISSSLYEIVQHNSASDIVASEIKDAYIREGSDTQDEVTKNIRYKGSFIVDIESLHQSYKVQYSYSSQENDTFVSGYPLLINCVDVDEVIYEDFDCKELIAVDESAQYNAIINFLPHTTISYEIRAELTGESLVIRANLRIPEVDLAGNQASKRNTVKLYKKQVTDWIEQQGFDVEEYNIKYNYSDDGELIEEIHSH